MFEFLGHVYVFDFQFFEFGGEAFIFEAIRTPRGTGKRSGALHGVKPIDLVVGLIDELRGRFPDLDEQRISDVILGCVTPVGDQGMDIARTAATAAGMPDSVAGVQLNRFCGSGLESVNLAAKSIRSGFDEMIIAGGVESMSRVAMGSDGGAMAMDPATAYDNYFIPQGIACDLLATINGISRRDVDECAMRSQQLAAAAWSGGYFARSVVPVKDINGLTILAEDEHMRPEVTADGLGKLGSAFAGLAELGGFDDVAKQRHGEQRRVDGPCLADRERGHGDAGGHLHDRVEAVLAGQMAAGYGHAQHGHGGLGGEHPGQVGCPARAGDDGPQAACPSRLGEGESGLGLVPTGRTIVRIRRPKNRLRLLLVRLLSSPRRPVRRETSPPTFRPLPQ